MDKQIDEAMVERLAIVLMARDGHLPVDVAERKAAELGPLAHAQYIASAGEVLTALSQDYAIVAKAEYESSETVLGIALGMILRGTPYCSPKVEAQYCHGAHGCVACLRQRITENVKEASPHV